MFYVCTGPRHSIFFYDWLMPSVVLQNAPRFGIGTHVKCATWAVLLPPNGYLCLTLLSKHIVVDVVARLFTSGFGHSAPSVKYTSLQKISNLHIARSELSHYLCIHSGVTNVFKIWPWNVSYISAFSMYARRYLMIGNGRIAQGHNTLKNKIKYKYVYGWLLNASCKK